MLRILHFRQRILTLSALRFFTFGRIILGGLTNYAMYFLLKMVWHKNGPENILQESDDLKDNIEIYWFARSSILSTAAG